MAIQNRRGSYADFDPSKLLPGEWAVVQSNDASARDGKAVYMAFTSGDVKRMATYEDMVDNLDDAIEEATQDAEEYALKAESFAVGKKDGTDVESSDPAYHNNSKYYSEQAAQSYASATSAVNTFVNTTVPAKVSEVTAEGTTQIGLVQAEGTTQTGLVTAEGTAQIAAVEAKGTETIASVPSDYTSVSNAMLFFDEDGYLCFKDYLDD